MTIKNSPVGYNLVLKIAKRDESEENLMVPEPVEESILLA